MARSWSQCTSEYYRAPYSTRKCTIVLGSDSAPPSTRKCTPKYYTRKCTVVRQPPFGAEATALISSLLSSTAGRGQVRWPRAGASYLMWARRPRVFYIKTSVKSQTFRNLYLLTSSNSPKVGKSRQDPASQHMMMIAFVGPASGRAARRVPGGRRRTATRYS